MSIQAARAAARPISCVIAMAAALLLAVPLRAQADMQGQPALEAASAKYQQIIVERRGAVIIGKFNNPPRQTMNGRTVEELSNLLAHVQHDDDVRVLVLTGADPAFFIAHYDLGSAGVAFEPIEDPIQEQVRSEQDLPPGLHALNRALLQMEALPKPVLCAINGQAHGGGFETALACDFRFMSASATVGLIETRAGIIPGAGGTQRLPRLVGTGIARRHIYLGEPVDAATAHQLGMVDEVVGPDRLLAETLAFAERLMQIRPESLHEAKRAINQGMELPLPDALLVEQAGFTRTLRTRFR
jgi:enoyl-CoA hydratase/carnithine racemase